MLTSRSVFLYKQMYSINTIYQMSGNYTYCLFCCDFKVSSLTLKIPHFKKYSINIMITLEGKDKLIFSEKCLSYDI